MAIPVTRISLRLNPNYKKVIPRFFNTGTERSIMILNRVIELSQTDTEKLLNNIYAEFSNRYRNIKSIFLEHYDLTKYLMEEYNQQALSEEKKCLIGAYFTMEYSIEAAALFNPSIVEDPDLHDAVDGRMNVIVSFRATGESHISSLVFKRGKLDRNGWIDFEPSGRFLREGVVTQRKNDSKLQFKHLLGTLHIPQDIINNILNGLKDTFSYKEIEVVLKDALSGISSLSARKKTKYDILSMVNTSYELQFPGDSLLSERVIFPVTLTEKNGIEDARFVKFTEEDGTIIYIATYTAYDGSYILPQLIVTRDFLHFKIAPLHGKCAINKNLALFPRRINGQYAMISRIDGFNNYLMFSDDLYLWEEATLVQTPKYPWEFIQIGNGGSPIETDKGWLVITHGVGPMRKYCLGASLFDLANPLKELGRLREPFLVPNEDEREGYVPNVVYSCGSIINGDHLFIPYAVSDHASSFATVPLKELLDEIMKTS